MKVEVLTSVKAKRGAELRCKGWKQESLLRMLENNMENGQDISQLIIYGGIAKAARNWESYHAIVDSLKGLENDETLVVQAGMPVAVFKTHRLAPRVVMGLTNVINATWPVFYDLIDKNLTTFSSYTAGPWEYIGSQGVVEGTFETLACIADEKFKSDLTGKVFFTAGLGGMGRCQPKAMTMHGGVSVTVEVRRDVVDDKISQGWGDVEASNLDEAISMAKKACEEKKPLAIILCGNMVDICEEAVEKKWIPEIVTEMCPFHDPFAVIPSGYTPDEADKMLKRSRDEYLVESRKTILRMVKVMNRLMDTGSEVFEYGTFVRKEAVDAGMSREEAFRYPGFVARYWRPTLFELGRGPFRWTCISGAVSDRDRLDQLALELFPDCPITQRWIPLARTHLPIEGLPARVCYMGFGQRKTFALAANELVRKGELKGPVAFARDNLDVGSIANPTMETEDMKDGSDAIADWPFLNALLNTAAMADLVSIQSNGTMGVSHHTAATMIADGSEEADLRLEASMTTDVGIGIVRYAQAGYETARMVADGKGPLSDDKINVPLWWSPDATFGPTDES
jgi:urocanate hydratase